MSTRTSSSKSQQKHTAATQKRLAELAEQERARRRKQVGLGGGTVVVLVVVVLIIARLASGGTTTKAAAVTKGGTAYQQVAAVSQSVINTVGAGTGVSAPTPLAGATPVSDSGKPQVSYVGAEYCPYCAAERWALVQALSRFGTFSNLGETRSSSTDVYPSTATLDFVGSSYTSSYLSFKGFEVEDGTGKALQTPSPDVEALFTKYGNGGFPFADLGGTSVTGVSYDPGVLKGLDQDQIAADLANPASPVAKAVVGSANAITKTLCAQTKNLPAAVCTASGVTSAA